MNKRTYSIILLVLIATIAQAQATSEIHAELKTVKTISPHHENSVVWSLTSDDGQLIENAKVKLWLARPDGDIIIHEEEVASNGVALIYVPARLTDQEGTYTAWIDVYKDGYKDAHEFGSFEVK